MPPLKFVWTLKKKSAKAIKKNHSDQACYFPNFILVGLWQMKIIFWVLFFVFLFFSYDYLINMKLWLICIVENNNWRAMNSSFCVCNINAEITLVSYTIFPIKNKIWCSSARRNISSTLSTAGLCQLYQLVLFVHLSCVHHASQKEESGCKSTRFSLKEVAFLIWSKPSMVWCSKKIFMHHKSFLLIESHNL